MSTDKQFRLEDHLEALSSADEVGELSSDDHIFNRHALGLAKWQYEHNVAYRSYVDMLGPSYSPRYWIKWQDIVPMPVQMSKMASVRTVEEGLPQSVEEGGYEWSSSGTTSNNPSKTFLPETSFYDLAIEEALSFVPDYFHKESTEKTIKIGLIPTVKDWPHSSLAYMFSRMFDNTGEYVEVSEDRFHLDFEKIAWTLQKADVPVLLYGTSYAFVQLFDYFEEVGGFSLTLPEGSRMIDTGGFKGITREVPREEMLVLAEESLGLAPHHCINEYGMSELSSQFWNSGLEEYDRLPWVRVLTMNPETLVLAKEGVLCVYDLTNVYTTMAVMTQDLSEVSQDGSKIRPLGRARGAEPKGCSIAAERAMQ